MPVTRFNDAVNALIAAYQAAPAFEGVPVYDSVQAMAGTDGDFIVVGHDGSLQADGMLSANAPAGTFSQQDLAMTAIAQETGFVNCLIVSQTGDAGDVTARRQRASDLLGAAEDAIAANGGLQSGAAAGIMFDGTSDGRFVNWLSRGVAVLLPYRVSYSTEWD
jgi:hypothetical protein